MHHNTWIIHAKEGHGPRGHNRKDGYVSETVTLTSGVGGTVAGNILLGGIIGGGIDMASGAAYKLYPETINIALREGGPSVVKQPQQQIKPEQDPKVIATFLPAQSPPKKPQSVKHYATLTHTKGQCSPAPLRPCEQNT
jgi:hypothetical protein